jgi:Icc-related predicted phosphoesterase
LKIVALADLHGNLPNIPPCDLLVIAGDVCPDNPQTMRSRLKCAQLQADWLDEHFTPWLRAQPFKSCAFIWGNHDFIGEVPIMWPTFQTVGKDIHLLQDSQTLVGVEDEVVRVWGAPWVGNIPMWAMNLPQEELTAKWQYIPYGLDILLTHAPPANVGDFCRGYGNVGDPGLRYALDNMGDFNRPRLHFFGHIHEGRGAYVKGMHNVSYVDFKYDPYELPIFEMDYKPNALLT